MSPRRTSEVVALVATFQLITVFEPAPRFSRTRLSTSGGAGAGTPTHVAPAVQTSPVVHELPSSHAVPAVGAFTQPVTALQLSAVHE